MNKILITIFSLILSASTVFAKDMRFIQVDSSLCSSANSEKFETLVTKINNEKNVDFVVFTGDNIAKSNKKNLETFVSKAKKLNAPFYVVLGNKDLNKQKELGKKEYMEYLGENIRFYKKINSPSYSFEKNKWLFIVVDGAKEVIPTSGGYFKAETLDWLSNQLTINKDKNVVIFQHFPIIPPANKETKMTYKAEDYLEMLAEHKNIKAIVSGNFNVNNEKDVANILHISTANAPQYRVVDIMGYDTDSPMFWSTIKE